MYSLEFAIRHFKLGRISLLSHHICLRCPVFNIRIVVWGFQRIWIGPAFLAEAATGHNARDGQQANETACTRNDIQQCFLSKLHPENFCSFSKFWVTLVRGALCVASLRILLIKSFLRLSISICFRTWYDIDHRLWRRWWRRWKK